MQVLIDRCSSPAEKKKKQRAHTGVEGRVMSVKTIVLVKNNCSMTGRRKGKNIHLYRCERKGDGALFGAMGREKPIHILGLLTCLHGVNERF
jgi:hypothetical protein